MSKTTRGPCKEPFVLALACAAAFAAGCALEPATDADVAVTVQALTSQSFSMPDAYNGTSSSGSACSTLSSNKKDIVGHEPAEPGTYPVAVYMTGTSGAFNSATALRFTEKMAQRGFVAATVEYSNGNYPGCTTLRGRASCIFNAASANSAITKLCARPKAGNCSKGIVTAGLSQGANIASLAKNYDGRARAAYLMANVITPSFFNNTSCLEDRATTFRGSELRAISGESDEYMTGLTELRSNLNSATGLNCTGMTCLQPDGSGWHIVTDPQVTDDEADHCYMLVGGCSPTAPLDPIYDTGAELWSSSTNYDWLASRVTF
jgi:hypothetical protein